MRLLRPVVTLLAVLLFLLLTSANGQFGGLKDKLKKARETAMKAGEGAIGGADKPSSPPAAPSSGKAAEPADTQSAARASREIIPGLAVDETELLRQEGLLRQACSNLSGANAMDCDCAVKGYRKARLQLLSEMINRARATRDRNCASGGNAAACATGNRDVDYWEHKEVQIDYPDNWKSLSGERQPAQERRPGHREPKPWTAEQFLGKFKLMLDVNCKDGSPEAQRVLETCMAREHTLPPGKSTKSFCECVSEDVKVSLEALPGSAGSSERVRAEAASYRKCRK